MPKKFNPDFDFNSAGLAGLERLQQELGRVFNLDEILRDDVTDAATSDWKPSVDIHEDDQQYVIVADLPGVDPEAIELSLQRGVLTVSGGRSTLSEPGKPLTRQERRTGNFSRRFTLPESADESSVDASSRFGVLTIAVRKQNSVQPRTIKVVSG